MLRPREMPVSGVRVKKTPECRAGVHRSQAEEDQDKDRHDQSQQHGSATEKITNFFFEDRRHWWGESRQNPAQPQETDLWAERDGGHFAQVFAAILRQQPHVQAVACGEHKGAQQRERTERGRPLRIYTLCDGIGGKAGRKDCPAPGRQLRRVAVLRARRLPKYAASAARSTENSASSERTKRP